MKPQNSFKKVPVSDSRPDSGAKQKARFRMLASVAIASVFLITGPTASASGTNYYWDTSASTGMTPGAGTWDSGTTANWATSTNPGTTAPITWVDGNNAYLQTGGTDTITITGTVTTPQLTISGSNTNNSYPTTVFINGGTLTLDNTPGASLITVSTPATTTINSAILLTGTSNRSMLNISNNAHLVLNGNITETGVMKTLRVFGSVGSDVTLSGSNSFTGGMQLDNAAALIVTNTAVFGTGNILFGKAGTATTGQQLTFNLATSGTVSNGLLFGGVSGTAMQVSILSNGAAITLSSNTNNGGSAGLSALGASAVPLNLILGGTSTAANTYSGLIGNSGTAGSGNYTSITKQGSGKWILSGTNTYTGATTVSAGELDVNGAISGASAVSIASGATLGGSGTAGGSVTVAGGAISGSGLLIGGSATFTGNSALSGLNTINGGVTATSGILTITGTTSGAFSVSSGATLAGSGKANGSVSGTSATINGTGLTLGATTLHGTSTLSGTNSATSVTIADGTTTLSGSASSSSTLTVKAGATLNNTGSANATTTTVESGATLTNNGTVTGAVNVTGLFNGTGTVNGSLTIKSTGELSPGNSPGITTVTGALVVESGAKISMQIDGLTGAGVTGGYDQIVVTNTGSVTLNVGSILNLTLNTTLAIGDTITLIDNQTTAAISEKFTTVTIGSNTYDVSTSDLFTYNGQDFALSYTGTAGGDGIGNDLTLMVVPEPSTWAMLAGGLGMLAFGQRLRRRRVA